MSMNVINGDFKSEISDIPMIGMCTDYENSAIEITIESSMFNTENIEKYITKIRSIVGYEINLTFVPGNRPVLKPKLLHNSFSLTNKR